MDSGNGNTVERNYDIIVVGGGILGVTLSYWLSTVPGLKIALIEASDDVARHSSSRNTGVIHRPFYMNPEKKKLFAWASQKSYGMWKSFAMSFNLPWNPTGTLEIARREEDLGRLDNFSRWAVQNGMESSEFTVFNRSDMISKYPFLRGHGAILSRTDTSVDFGIFTRSIFKSIKNDDFTFIPDTSVEAESIDTNRSILMASNGKRKMRIGFHHLINAAGSDSLNIAHAMGLALDKAMLHFRGDYWKVANNKLREIENNIYTIPEHPEFPFLDPHFIVRHDNSRQIGPNAAPVFSPYAYEGISERFLDPFRTLFEKPVIPKLKLFLNHEFLSLAGSEWKSSLSKKKMGLRVKAFIPKFSIDMLLDRGIAGIRHSVVDAKGFLEDSIILNASNSTHILNYNSPGATGAPAYSAHIVQDMLNSGLLGERRDLDEQLGKIWKFEEVYP